MSLLDEVKITLGATVAGGGTFTTAYPAGRTAKDYLGGTGHVIHSRSRPSAYAEGGDFAVAFGPANIAVTMLRGQGYAAGEKLSLMLERADSKSDVLLASSARMAALTPIRIALGKPLAASATAIVASQAATAANGLATGINGAQASAGQVTLATPRNVVAAWTGNAVLTVIGVDEHGAPMRESSAAGTSFTGKKAFKQITRITVSANVTALTVGTGNVLGLPAYLADLVDVTREIQDGAAAAAGTVVAGDVATPTATTGDVRGTYTPAAAPDGVRVYELNAVLRAPAYRGAPQFAG